MHAQYHSHVDCCIQRECIRHCTQNSYPLISYIVFISRFKYIKFVDDYMLCDLKPKQFRIREEEASSLHNIQLDMNDLCSAAYKHHRLLALYIYLCLFQGSRHTRSIYNSDRVHHFNGDDVVLVQYVCVCVVVFINKCTLQNKYVHQAHRNIYAITR